MNKILVTGADGFIGSHLVESLVEKGYSVKAFAFIIHGAAGVGLIQSPQNTKSKIEVFLGDVRDPSQLDKR